MGPPKQWDYQKKVGEKRKGNGEPGKVTGLGYSRYLGCLPVTRVKCTQGAHHMAQVHILACSAHWLPGTPSPGPRLLSLPCHPACELHSGRYCVIRSPQDIHDLAHSSVAGRLGPSAWPWGRRQSDTHTVDGRDFNPSSLAPLLLSMAFLSFRFPTCNVGMTTVPTSQEGCLSSSQHRAWHVVLNPYYLL